MSLDEKLKAIANAFASNLERVAAVAKGGTGMVKQYAARETGGMPLKHVIAATFALSEDELGRVLGPLWWRCSMSEGKRKGEPTVTKMVKAILAAVEEEAEQTYDAWPPIEEFMHDFSASSHSIPQLAGYAEGFTWQKGDEFRLLFATESEMAKGKPGKRSQAINRDLVKLCLVECPVKAVVYRGYEKTPPKNATGRGSLIDGIVETISRCPSPGKRNEAWLFIGLTGKWPKTTKPYFHTLKVGDVLAQPWDW
jgi:hypothetical protein